MLAAHSRLSSSSPAGLGGGVGGAARGGGHDQATAEAGAENVKPGSSGSGVCRAGARRVQPAGPLTIQGS